MSSPHGVNVLYAYADSNFEGLDWRCCSVSALRGSDRNADQVRVHKILYIFRDLV